MKYQPQQERARKETDASPIITEVEEGVEI